MSPGIISDEETRNVLYRFCWTEMCPAKLIQLKWKKHYCVNLSLMQNEIITECHQQILWVGSTVCIWSCWWWRSRSTTWKKRSWHQRRREGDQCKFKRNTFHPYKGCPCSQNKEKCLQHSVRGRKPLIIDENVGVSHVTAATSTS